MARLTVLITSWCLVLSLAGADGVLPDRALRALDEHAAFEAEQQRRTAAFAAEQAAERVRARERLIDGLKRSLSRRSSVAEQAAVYREVLAHDAADSDARGFFEATGILDKVLAEVEVQASPPLGADPLGTDLLAAATAAVAGPLAAALPDAAFTASTMWNAALAPASARFTGADGWAVGRVDQDPWLQVDLGAMREIHAVGTLGRGRANQHVTAYRLSFSHDGETWVPLPGPDGEPAVLDGNVDKDVEVRHDFPQAVVARFVRFHPETWSGYRSMRVEVYGR